MADPTIGWTDDVTISFPTKAHGCPGRAAGVHFYPGNSKRCLCGKTTDDLLGMHAAGLRAAREAKEMGWP